MRSDQTSVVGCRAGRCIGRRIGHRRAIARVSTKRCQIRFGFEQSQISRFRRRNSERFEGFVNQLRLGQHATANVANVPVAGLGLLRLRKSVQCGFVIPGVVECASQAGPQRVHPVLRRDDRHRGGLRSWDCDVTTDSFGVQIRSDLYIECGGSAGSVSCEVSGSGVDLIGIGGATAESEQDIEGQTLTANYTFHGADTLVVNINAQRCISWHIKGSDRHSMPVCAP